MGDFGQPYFWAKIKGGVEKKTTKKQKKLKRRKKRRKIEKKVTKRLVLLCVFCKNCTMFSIRAFSW